MGLLPDINEDGTLGEIKKIPELYTPKATDFHARLKEEERLTEINNLGRRTVTKDFSDSPHLNR